VSSNGWIKITSATNATGSGTVSYTVAATPARVAGRVLEHWRSNLCRQQDGVPAPMSCSRLAGSIITGGVRDFQRHRPRGCDWTSVNTNDWMAIKLYTNGTGNGIVRYSVFATRTRSTNRFADRERSAVHHHSTAAPAPIQFRPTNYFLGSATVSGSVAVFTADGCDWSASNTNGWITIAATMEQGAAW